MFSFPLANSPRAHNFNLEWRKPRALLFLLEDLGICLWFVSCTWLLERQEQPSKAGLTITSIFCSAKHADRVFFPPNVDRRDGFDASFYQEELRITALEKDTARGKFSKYGCSPLP